MPVPAAPGASSIEPIAPLVATSADMTPEGLGVCGVRDVDTLLASVRDPGSRRQFTDAVRAYQGGAFRAAIISTWVAVALDLVSKLRELADDGDQAAASELAILDSAIEAKDKSRLQKFENGLLDMCRDQFELISGRDHDVLTRLVSDRNVCAHPAFVSPDAVFSPSAEEARAHLASAVDAVLQHPPTPGKRLVQRFKAEIGGSAWPGNQSDLVDYLAERYFGQQRESARRQLAELIIKCSLGLPIDVPNRERLRLRYPKCARALNDVSPAQFDDAIASVVRKKEETVGLNEDEIRHAVGAFGDIATFWIAIPSTSGARVAKCIHDSDEQTLATAGVLAASPPDEGVGAKVRAVIQQKIDSASASVLVDALALGASESLIEGTVARVEPAHRGTPPTCYYRCSPHSHQASSPAMSNDCAQLLVRTTRSTKRTLPTTSCQSYSSKPLGGRRSVRHGSMSRTFITRIRHRPDPPSAG